MGVQVLTHLLNAVLATRCVPSAWRKDIVVHLAKGGDAGTALTTGRLHFSQLSTSCSPSSSQSGLHVSCVCTTSHMRSALAEAHSIHYTTCWQSCGNKLKLTKPHTRVSLMRQNFMTQHRTLSCSTVFSNVVSRDPPLQYSSASSRVRVGSALSPAIAVQRGVAQGCPYPPCCMQSFVEPMLQDMQALSHPDLLWVGPAAARRKLVGQACADDLPGIAATQQGLQRVVQAVRLHSLRWGWLLNVPKSIVMVFGARSVRARLGAPELWWGDGRQPTADTIKYLGLHPESCGGWVAQQAAADAWAALLRWLPVLRCQHLSAATKLLVRQLGVLLSRIAPCMSYGMELWRPAKRGANMTSVLTRTAQLIIGIRKDATHAFSWTVQSTRMWCLHILKFCRLMSTAAWHTSSNPIV